MEKTLHLILSWKMAKAIFDLFFRYIPTYLYVLLTQTKKQLWLICERSTDARDNGYVLFKWIRENHPEIKVIYAINRKSQDYNNVKDLGTVIEYGSIKHYFYYFTASICCDTSWNICAPNIFTCLLARNILPPKSKRVFLQHGIIKDYMPQGKKSKLKADIFVCGAYPEWEYISKNFGYTNGEVKYLGLARYDRLNNCCNQLQILFMPTWRVNLKDNIDFKSTKYYKTIISLLTSKSLNDFLKLNNIEFIYFIHPAIREYKRYFKHLENTHIKILNNEEYDMQKLICSANLLITDFSSIYFDFAYLGKPVVYYHFDYSDYRKEHYAEGYFSYEKDGFGPIVTDENMLIDKLLFFSKNGWKIDDKYLNRSKRFFPLRDTNNCLRHFEALCELDKQFF